jgi:hypothetical protein
VACGISMAVAWGVVAKILGRRLHA